MLKNLTILALSAALLPACILDVGDTSTLSDTNVTSDTGSTGGSTGGTTGGTTDGTDSATTAGATDSGTTETPPTTGEPTTTTTTTDGTTGGTTGSGAEYGMCGWVAAESYYGCVDPDGAEPGAEDPAGIDPIACPDGLVEGAPCTDMDGPIDNIGCCAPNGDLYLCDSQGGTNTILKIACGA